MNTEKENKYPRHKGRNVNSKSNKLTKITTKKTKWKIFKFNIKEKDLMVQIVKLKSAFYVR